MCEVRFRGKTIKNQKNKTKYSGQQKNKMECDEPHLEPNEKT
jgi:hypothetical protein